MARRDRLHRFDDMNQKLVKWMQGRQGTDDLVVFCTYAALIVLIVNLFVNSTYLNWVGVLFIVYAAFRMFSKNLSARSRENAAFLKALGPLRDWFQNPKAAYAEAKEYKHVKCSDCGQRVRVPRGKGTLRVTCPNCQKKFG